MKHLVWAVILAVMFISPMSLPVSAQDGCSMAFDDARNFVAEVFERITVSEDGVIAWDTTDWENIVRCVVGSSEFYFNNYTDADLPVAEQVIYDRIHAEHLERKQIALVERRQRLSDWPELEVVAGDIPGHDGRANDGWVA